MLSRLSNGRLALLGLFASATSANLVFSGATIELNGDYYFIDPHVAGELPVHARNDSVLSSSYAAVTVVGSSGNATSLDSLLQSWTELDDVFTAEFLGGGVYIAHDSRLTSASTSTSTRLLNTTAPVYTLNDTASASALLPSGPYFLNVHTGSAHRALRLYDDHTSSFTGSLLQSPDGRRFQTLAAQRPTAMTLTVGVPSRLYYTRSALRPLAGLRLGVKDLYALRGARRSNGNRAWYHLYPDENMTAPAVQRLVDAGAVVVGYQSLAQFANGDHFAADAVDMQMPFNPRGDGYSVPLGSSSGAGASIAAYSWLDLALGSDTGGSVRNPAQVAGVFGNRPTTGLVTLDGVTPLSPTLDSPGFTARDPAIWDAAQQVLYGDNYTSLREVERPEYPKTIYTLDWPMGRTPELDAYFGSFLSAAAEITGAKVEAIDMHELWNRTRPAEVGDVDLSTYLNMTYPTLVAMEQSRLVRDPFFADYAKKHNGRKPFINPSARGRWEWASTLPESALADARREQQTFSQWFRTHVLAATGDARCSSALLLYSDHQGKPELREKQVPVRVPSGLYPVYYSPFSGTPDMAFPLGEVYTMSNITGQEEPLPVAADIMAAQGCDGLVTKLGLELVKKGVVKVPKAGGDLEGREILFRREMGL